MNNSKIGTLCTLAPFQTSEACNLIRNIDIYIWLCDHMCSQILVLYEYF